MHNNQVELPAGTRVRACHQQWPAATSNGTATVVRTVNRHRDGTWEYIVKTDAGVEKSWNIVDTVEQNTSGRNRGARRERVGRALVVLSAGLLIASSAGCASQPESTPEPVAAAPSEAVTYDRPASRTLTVEQVRLLVDLAYDQANLPATTPAEEIKSRAQSVVEQESHRQVATLFETALAPEGPALPDGGSQTAARGLGALIPAIFKKHHRPGTAWNIYDPVANVSALITYLDSRNSKGKQ